MNQNYKPARYVVLAQEIRKEVATKYSQKYQMSIFGIRGGLIKKVNLLGIEFVIKGPLTQEQLREILVDCVEGFLQALNSNEELRPFLKTYPFTEEGIDIGIYVKDGTGKSLYYPEIGFANAAKGEIRYRLYDPASALYQDKEVIIESYQDALKKLSIPRS